MIVFRKLFELLKSQGRSKYWLGKQISHGLVARFWRGESITSKKLDKVCSIMNCDISDIMEYIPDKKKD